MADSVPKGMEWQSYFSGFRSLGDIISGKADPSIASMLAGKAIDTLAGGSTDIGKSLGSNQQFFGGSPATPQPPVIPGSVPVPTAGQPPQIVGQPAPITGSPAPIANQPAPMTGQPAVTQPQYGPNAQPQTPGTPSYSRYLFAPQ